MADGAQTPIQPVQPVQRAAFHELSGPPMPRPISVQPPWQPPAWLGQAPQGAPQTAQLAPPAQLPAPVTYQVPDYTQQMIANFWKDYQPDPFTQAWHDLAQAQPGRSVQPTAAAPGPTQSAWAGFPMAAPIRKGSGK